MDWVTGVYQIRNKTTGKVYIGGAYKSFTLRLKFHRLHLNRGSHYNKHLQSAWSKYGKSDFVFSIVETCSPSDVKSREQYWLDNSKCLDPRFGYNISPNVGGGYKGMHTEDGLRRISEAMTGRVWSEERKESHSLKLKGNQHLVGHVHTDETKAKISESSKGRPASELCKLKSSQRMKDRNVTNPPRKGKKCSEEHRRKLSEAAKRRSKKCI